MLLTPDWAIFFSAELAALATLTGLVVVAISINLPRILAYAHLPTRAGEALIGPVGAITVTSLVLYRSSRSCCWARRSLSSAP
jgi:hypothetical protein